MWKFCSNREGVSELFTFKIMLEVCIYINLASRKHAIYSLSSSRFLWLVPWEFLVGNVFRFLFIFVLLTLFVWFFLFTFFAWWLCPWSGTFLWTLVCLPHELKEGYDQGGEDSPHQEVVDILILVVVDECICNERPARSMSHTNTRIVKPTLRWRRLSLF